MYYGLTYEDIVNSFSQCISGDFAVGSVDGQTIIEKEMEFQDQKLRATLSEEVLRLMDRVSGEVVMVTAANKFSPTLYADSTTLRGYIVPKSYSPCPGVSIEDTTTCWQSLQEQISITAANITADGDNVYTLVDTFDSKTSKLVVYYDVDQTELVVNSLKSTLRDMVCYSLGSRLFPVGSSDVWSIVQYYGEEAKKWLEMYEKGAYPAEFKKMSLVNKSIRGIGSLRLVRS